VCVEDVAVPVGGGALEPRVVARPIAERVGGVGGCGESCARESDQKDLAQWDVLGEASR
jgi:hypothetical protein